MIAPDLVPKSSNGKIDWLAYIRTTWPVVVIAGTILFYFGGRLQTVGEKYEQNEIWDKPWRQRIERNEIDISLLETRAMTHESLEGHPIMRAEYSNLLETIKRVEAHIKRIEVIILQRQEELDRQ